MKTIIIVLLCFLVSLVTIGQEENSQKKDEINSPSYTGVKNLEHVSIEKYICSELGKCEMVFEAGEAGTEVIKFSVDTDGNLSNIQVMNSVCQALDDEIVDILKSTNGMWTPAIKDGIPVTMDKEISIAFVCRDVEDCRAFMIENARKNFHKANQHMYVKNNPKRALKYYDKSIKYCPYETASLLLRGICKYENGDTEGANADWERLIELGEFDASEYINNLTYNGIKDDLKYSEAFAYMKEVLEK